MSDTPFVGVTFRITNLCRSIVGLHDVSLLDDSEPGNDAVWRRYLYSFHVSADLEDLDSLPQYRIYERGNLVKSLGTQTFRIGDTFSLRLRPNGTVVYQHNHHVIRIAESPTEFASGRRLRLSVRIASQSAPPALEDVALVKAETPSVIQLSGLFWHGSAAESSQNVSKGILRAWILGRDYVPATAQVKLELVDRPKWAYGAASLASFFALGGFGLHGGAVSTHLARQPSAAPLGVLPQQPTVAGVVRKSLP